MKSKIKHDSGFISIKDFKCKSINQFINCFCLENWLIKTK